MHLTITSTQNPKVKNLLALEKPRERRALGLFVVEGRKEIGLALDAGYEIENVFYCEALISREELKTSSFSDKLLISVTREVFDKIAIRENSGGLVMVAKQKTHSLDSIRLSANPLVLVLESVEKPGNLGAILRTADAAGLDAVIICDPKTDFYNPNVIRSSVGCIFTNQVATATSEEALSWLKKNNIVPYSTYLKASRPYHTVDYTKPCAIVMGTEATGLSDVWTAEDQNPIIIPMHGRIDSMNVSTAAAVIVFEARRQRGFA
ncbi:MAG: RNA methyltransferase [Cyclobacteriaceae bacterium]